MSRLLDVPQVLQPAISANAAERDLEPCAGDLWVLSWDGRYLGLAMIAAVKPDYVLAWPVTLPSDLAFAPALVLEQSPIGSPLTLWPTREIGMGMHLLHQPLGRLLDAKRIQPIAWALEDGENPGLPFASGSASDEANRDADEEFVNRWTDLCFHVWPSHSHRFLSESKIKNLGGSAAKAAKVLGLTPPLLRPLWTGVTPATEEQVQALATGLGFEVADILGEDPLARVTRRIAHPQFKQPLVDLADARQWSEEMARDSTRENYALAARDDSRTVVDQRIVDAIKRCQGTSTP
ncbi:hypothetical protein [Luteococcus japonicus]|uniref:hypothetical protein n=1 Tax=Luteococcus japonicus TaxID=33984 RepID=UPI00117D28D3|nr:hypothetical protein [Luteococcus japonicus]